MRVALIIPSLRVGGAEKILLDLASGLPGLGVEPVIICLSEPAGTIYEQAAAKHNTRIFYLPVKGFFDTRVIKNLYHLLCDLHPDVIHTHLNCSVYVLLWKIMHPKIKWLHTVHSTAEKEANLKNKIIMFILLHLNIMIPVAISDYVKGTVSKVYRLKPERIPLVYNGVDTKKFSPADGKEEPVYDFCCVARLTLLKNHKSLLNVLGDRIVGELPDAKLVLVGDGEVRNDIQRQVDALQLGRNVIFAGVAKDVAYWLRLSKIFVLISQYEGMPVSVLEAMSAGLPVICSNIASITELVEDGVNGITVSNEEELAAAMLSLCADKDRRKLMKSNNLKKSHQFDTDFMLQKYVQLYSEQIK